MPLPSGNKFIDDWWAWANANPPTELDKALVELDDAEIEIVPRMRATIDQLASALSGAMELVDRAYGHSAQDNDIAEVREFWQQAEAALTAAKRQ